MYLQSIAFKFDVCTAVGRCRLLADDLLDWSALNRQLGLCTHSKGFHNQLTIHGYHIQHSIVGDMLSEVVIYSHQFNDQVKIKNFMVFKTLPKILLKSTLQQHLFWLIKYHDQSCTQESNFHILNKIEELLKRLYILFIQYWLPIDATKLVQYIELHIWLQLFGLPYNLLSSALMRLL